MLVEKVKIEGNGQNDKTCEDPIANVFQDRRSRNGWGRRGFVACSIR